MWCECGVNVVWCQPCVSTLCNMGMDMRTNELHVYLW